MIDPQIAQRPLRFQDYERLTHKLARRLYGWSAARGRRGAQPSYEDIFQDLAVIWTQCRDRYDPNLGAQFSTYYTRAALNHWQVLARQVNRDNATVSFDEPVGASDDGEGLTLESVLTDPEDLDPEEAFSRRQWAEQSLAKSPLLARLVELSADPPEELEAELAAMRAQREWAAEQGVVMDGSAPTAFTPSLLNRTLRFNWRQRMLAQPKLSEAVL